LPDPLGGFAYTWPLYAAAVIAYLIGSIPFGFLLTRTAGLADIRRSGSGGIGATNVLRTGRKDLAVATLLLDGGKGAFAAYFAARYGPDVQVIASTAVVIGHMFPIWLKFRGGKGVATVLGVLLVVSWPVGLASLAIWLVIAATTRYSSLSSIVAIAAAPLLLWVMLQQQRGGHLPPEWPGLPQHVELLAVLAVIVVVKHYANIRRLLSGTESRIRLGRSQRES